MRINRSSAPHATSISLEATDLNAIVARVRDLRQRLPSLSPDAALALVVRDMFAPLAGAGCASCELTLGPRVVLTFQPFPAPPLVPTQAKELVCSERATPR